MRNHELAMLAYAKLARISHEKQQLIGRDRFLVSAGFEACHAGALDVAARCRELVLLENPRHLLSRASSFPETIRDRETEGFFRGLQKVCSFEQAEMLLREHGEWSGSIESEQDQFDDPANDALIELAVLG